jgi:hypothetical protein
MKPSQNSQSPDVKINATIKSDMKYYGNDPYFVKKNKESQDFLKQHGFPDELLRIKKERL